VAWACAATRIWKQHGFADVTSLSGGATIRNRIVGRSLAHF
jgi:hypothetical protein